MIEFINRICFLLCLVYMTGCALSPLSDLDLSSTSVKSILVSGHRNLGDTQVRVTDADEIDQILKLVHSVRGYKSSRWNLDIEQSKVVGLRIEHADGPTDLTMVSGALRVPGDDLGLFYDTQKDAQSELWNLALKYLEKSDTQ